MAGDPRDTVPAPNCNVQQLRYNLLGKRDSPRAVALTKLRVNLLPLILSREDYTTASLQIRGHKQKFMAGN